MNQLLYSSTNWLQIWFTYTWTHAKQKYVYRFSKFCFLLIFESLQSTIRNIRWDSCSWNLKREGRRKKSQLLQTYFYSLQNSEFFGTKMEPVAQKLTELIHFECKKDLRKMNMEKKASKVWVFFSRKCCSFKPIPKNYYSYS